MNEIINMEADPVERMAQISSNLLRKTESGEMEWEKIREKADGPWFRITFKGGIPALPGFSVQLFGRVYACRTAGSPFQATINGHTEHFGFEEVGLRIYKNSKILPIFTKIEGNCFCGEQDCMDCYEPRVSNRDSEEFHSPLWLFTKLIEGQCYRFPSCPQIVKGGQ